MTGADRFVVVRFPVHLIRSEGTLANSVNEGNCKFILGL